METTCQASYPLNSENESPPGTFKVYLSCAKIAQQPMKASIPVIVGIVSIHLRFIASTSFMKVYHPNFTSSFTFEKYLPAIFRKTAAAGLSGFAFIPISTEVQCRDRTLLKTTPG